MRDKGANAAYRWAHEVRRKSEQYGGRLSRGGRTVATAARPTCSSIAELCQRVSFFAAPQRHVYVEPRPPAAILLVHMSMRPISVKGMGRRTVTRALSLLLFWASSQNSKKEPKREPHLTKQKIVVYTVRQRAVFRERQRMKKHMREKYNT